MSTHPEAEATGARAHVLGVMGGFEKLGWRVSSFIVGDRVPRTWTGQGSRQAVGKGLLRRVAADCARLLLARVNARRASRKMASDSDWAYERFGAFQSLGRAVQRKGVPWILETNAPLFYEAKFERNSMALTGLARRLEVSAYRDCDVLVCVSEELRDIVIKAARVDPRKVIVVPNGVDVEFFDPSLYEPRRVFDQFTIGFVGNLYPGAGIDLLLDALHELRFEGLDAAAVIVGDGVMRKPWEDKAKALGLTDCVEFVGQVPRQEVPCYTIGFDLGYSGQVAGHFGRMYRSPLKIYEYMACGKPVIASSYDDARSAIRERETGFLFEPGDKEDLKRAIGQAYETRASLAAMGREAREDAIANHSWEARVRTMIVEIERVLEAR